MWLNISSVFWPRDVQKPTFVPPYELWRLWNRTNNWTERRKVEESNFSAQMQILMHTGFSRIAAELGARWFYTFSGVFTALFLSHFFFFFWACKDLLLTPCSSSCFSRPLYDARCVSKVFICLKVDQTVCLTSLMFGLCIFISFFV